MPRTLAKAKGRRESGCFLRVPSAVLDSENFRTLSSKAKALILDIGARYNGHNNGDLAAPWSWMRQRNWRSKDTLQRALVELRHFGMIDVTRQGGLHGPTLYAFTWMAVDRGKVRLDVPILPTASGRWRQPVLPLPAAPRKKLPPRSSGHTTPTIGPDVVKKSPRRPDHRGDKVEKAADAAPTVGHL